MELPSPPANLPSPPFYNVSGIANLRDIGGYSCPAPQSANHASSNSTTDSSGPSYSIARHLVYRSADPSRVTPVGVERLQELGVRVVFDLRSMPEILRHGKEWEGVDKNLKPFREREVRANGAPTTSARPGMSRADTERAIERGELGVPDALKTEQELDQERGVIERVWTPVFSEEDYSPEKIALRYKDYVSQSDEVSLFLSDIQSHHQGCWWLTCGRDL